MKKQDVLDAIAKFNGRPIELGLADEGVVLHAGIPGHWLFSEGDNLVEIRVNSNDGTYGFSSIDQKNYPFKITKIQFDTVNYVRSYIGGIPGDIKKMTTGMEIIGAGDITTDEAIKQIQTDSINKASSPRGNANCDEVAPGGSGMYGKFNGSVVSTDINGLPEYYNNLLK